MRWSRRRAVLTCAQPAVCLSDQRVRGRESASVADPSRQFEKLYLQPGGTQSRRSSSSRDLDWADRQASPATSVIRRRVREPYSIRLTVQSDSLASVLGDAMPANLRRSMSVFGPSRCTSVRCDVCGRAESVQWVSAPRTLLRTWPSCAACRGAVLTSIAAPLRTSGVWSS